MVYYTSLMYLHFEDWSEPMWLNHLESKKLPHVGRIIKVLASGADPRSVLERPGLSVVESSGAPFKPDEDYDYYPRSIYTGPDLESQLASYNLSDFAQRIVRSLFRFANSQGFCQTAMAAKKDDSDWLIDHPLEDIDGIENAQRSPRREAFIHLDIFFPKSIEALRSVIDLDNPEALLGAREGVAFISRQRA